MAIALALAHTPHTGASNKGHTMARKSTPTTTTAPAAPQPEVNATTTPTTPTTPTTAPAGPWYTTAAGVAMAQGAASAHWGAPCRVPASHRWLAAAAWVAGATSPTEANAHAALAAATMGWPASVVPPVAFCRANWLFAQRRGTPYPGAKPAPLGKASAPAAPALALGAPVLVCPEANA